MRRIILSAGCLLSVSTPVAAHESGQAPTELLGTVDGEATFVRLNRGLAYRTPDGFGFLCPEAWGGDVGSPIVATASGYVLVAGERLLVVAPNGRVSFHDDAPGAGVALAAGPGAVYGLFRDREGDSLWRVSEVSAERLIPLPGRFESIAVTEAGVSLLSWDENRLVLQRVSLDGELGRWLSFDTPSFVADAELRRAAEEVFVVVWGSAAPWVTLGRFSREDYEVLREADGSIVGPVELGDDWLLGADGQLDWLSAGVPLAGFGHIDCLGSSAESAYFCTKGELHRLDPSFEWVRLFDIAQLHEPDYRTLPLPLRAACRTRWLDLQNDLAPRALASEPIGGSADAEQPDAVERGAGCAVWSDAVPRLGGRSGLLWIYLLWAASTRKHRARSAPRVRGLFVATWGRPPSRTTRASAGARRPRRVRGRR